MGKGSRKLIAEEVLRFADIKHNREADQGLRHICQKVERGETTQFLLESILVQLSLDHPGEIEFDRQENRVDHRKSDEHA